MARTEDHRVPGNYDAQHTPPFAPSGGWDGGAQLEERVAKAIWDAATKKAGTPWSMLREERQEPWRDMARAVIAELSKPHPNGESSDGATHQKGQNAH